MLFSSLINPRSYYSGCWWSMCVAAESTEGGWCQSDGELPQSAVEQVSAGVWEGQSGGAGHCRATETHWRSHFSQFCCQLLLWPCRVNLSSGYKDRLGPFPVWTVTGMETTYTIAISYYYWYICISHVYLFVWLPSMLWRGWLGGMKGIRPVKNWVVGCRHGCLSGARSKFCICPSWCHCHSLSLAPVNPDWFYLSDTSLPW